MYKAYHPLLSLYIAPRLPRPEKKKQKTRFCEALRHRTAGISRQADHQRVGLRQGHGAHAAAEAGHVAGGRILGAWRWRQNTPTYGGEKPGPL